MRRKAKARKKTKYAARDRYLRAHYGISHAEFTKLAARYCGGCWICKSAPKANRNHAVDHDHKVAKVGGTRASIRGILCFQCNRRLIGRRRREHAVLYLAAAGYLESDEAQVILGRVSG